jgi:hypothetical protein
MLQIHVPGASGSGSSPDDAGFHQRFRLLSSAAAWSAVLASLSILSLFAGYPLAAGRWGSVGGLGTIFASLLLSFLTALVTRRGLRRAGLTAQASWRRMLKLVWPLSCPLAPELLLSAAAEGYHPLAVAKALLPDEAFREFVRPLVFDAEAAAGGQDAPGRALTPAAWDRVLYPATFASTANGARRHLAGSTAAAVCPRCGREYLRAGGECGDCAGVALAVIGR